MVGPRALGGSTYRTLFRPMGEREKVEVKDKKKEKKEEKGRFKDKNYTVIHLIKTKKR